MPVGPCYSTPMKLKTITYRRGVTLNIGDFESVRVEVGADADVEVRVDLDDSEEGNAGFERAYAALKATVDEAVGREVTGVRKLMEKRRKASERAMEEKAREDEAEGPATNQAPVASS